MACAACGGRAVAMLERLGFKTEEITHPEPGLYLRLRTEFGIVDIRGRELKHHPTRLSIYGILAFLFPRWATRHPWRGVYVEPSREVDNGQRTTGSVEA